MKITSKIAILSAFVFCAVLTVTPADAIGYEYEYASVRGAVEGTQESEYFGDIVLADTDLDGDGYNDLIVSATGYQVGESFSFEGRVLVFYGNGTTIDNLTADEADAEFLGVDTYGGLGQDLDVGDLDGDGNMDLVLGAYNLNSDGAVYIYYGTGSRFSGSQTVSTADATIVSAVSNDGGLGWEGEIVVANFNGDTYDDLLLSDSSEDSYAGEAYVFYGSAVQFSGSYDSDDADAEFTTTDTSAALGNLVGAADINGDGYQEYIIGARNGNGSKGEVHVYYGSSTKLSGSYVVDSTSDVRITHSESLARSGDTFVTPGDIDGDGYDELLFRYYVLSDTNYRQGGAYLLYGGTSWAEDITMNTDYDARFLGYTFLDYAASAIGYGDINGDGYIDLGFSSAKLLNQTGEEVGGTNVYYGSNTQYSGTIELADSDIQLIDSAAVESSDPVSWGDLNGDGYDELLIARAFADATGADSAGVIDVLYYNEDLPTITEHTAVSTPTRSTTPEYAISASGEGVFAVGGSCSATEYILTEGVQRFSFFDDVDGTSLADGIYSDCTVTAHGYWIQGEAAVDVTDFVVDTTVPTITALTPIDESEDIDVSSQLVITYSESVTAATGNIEVSNAYTDTVVETIDVTGEQVSIDDNIMTISLLDELDPLVRYSIALDAGVVADAAGNASLAVGDSVDWVFTTDGTAGATLTTDETTVTEGDVLTYSIVLATQPEQDVTVSVATESEDVIIAPAVLTFTNANWNVAQEFIITATDNSDYSGNTSAVVTYTFESDDLRYALIELTATTVTVEDDDSAPEEEAEPTAVVSFERMTQGRVKVLYDDDSENIFTVFSISDKPKVQLHRNGRILIAVNKRYMRTFDAFTGEQIDQVKLFKNKQYKTKFKRYNIYKKKPGQNNIIVLAQTKKKQNKQFKMRSFVVKNGGDIVRRNVEVIELNTPLKQFKNLSTKKNKKFGKKARIRVTKKGRVLQNYTFRVTKKKGKLL